MRLINKIDAAINMLNYRIKKIEMNQYSQKPYQSFDRGYDAGYKNALECYVRELEELKNMMLNICLIQFGDDDDV
jgi:hypothetical protein